MPRGRPSRFGSPANVVIRVKVTRDQRDRLEAAARQNAATMTDVIRDAVDDYVADYSDDAVFAAAR